MIIVLMGVTGSGKTTVGRLLAEDLDWTYFDADDFHPELNLEKMKSGTLEVEMRGNTGEVRQNLGASRT